MSSDSSRESLKRIYDGALRVGIIIDESRASFGNWLTQHFLRISMQVFKTGHYDEISFHSIDDFTGYPGFAKNLFQPGYTARHYDTHDHYGRLHHMFCEIDVASDGASIRVYHGRKETQTGTVLRLSRVSEGQYAVRDFCVYRRGYLCAHEPRTEERVEEFIGEIMHAINRPHKKPVLQVVKGGLDA